MKVPMALLAADPAWLPLLSVGGPIATAIGLVGGLIKWLYDMKKNRGTTALTDAQTDNQIVLATKELIGVVRSELAILKAANAEKDIDNEALHTRLKVRELRIELLETLLARHGIAIPSSVSLVRDPTPTPTTNTEDAS